MYQLQEALKVGDRVKLATAFLRSTGMYVGEFGFQRGVITSLHSFERCVNVTWDHEPEREVGIMRSNLWPERLGHLEVI